MSGIPSPRVGGSSSGGQNVSTQSSETPTSTPPFPNSKDPTWKYTGCKDPNQPMKVFCKLCNKAYSGGINRAKEHLSHTPGNIVGCSKATMEIINEIRGFMKEKKEKKNEKKRLNSVFEGHDRFLDDEREEEVRILEGEDDENEDMVPSRGRKRKLVDTQRGPMDAHCRKDLSKMKQSQLEQSNKYKEQEKLEAWKAYEIWAIEAGIAFNAVRFPSFQTFIYAVGKYGRGMPAPSYYHVRVTLLKEVYDDTKVFVESFRAHWKKYGCSIMSDFWTDGKGRSLINFLVNCPKGTVFLKSIDASEHVKDADLIVGMMEEVIQDVGEENIVQFITDNGSNYVRAGSILEAKYPKLFWAPCGAHCVNLMLQDLGESMERPLNKIGKVLKDARKIVVFIYNHGRVLYWMRVATKKRELHRSCVTRFATQYYTLESIDKHKNALKMLFMSEAWVKSDFAKKVEGKNITKIVCRKSFWDDVRFACSILAPLVDVIRLVDTEEKPCMGYIYEAMDRAKEQIKKNIGEDKAITNEAKRECRRVVSIVWRVIDDRWNEQLDRPLHSAGLYLNPGFYYKQSREDTMLIEGNQEIKSKLFKVFNKLVPDFDENDKLVTELVLYRDALKSFGEPQAIRSREKLSPVEWWITFGSSAPTLQRLAVRVLSQTCSASPCERNWSAFDNVHSKKRNNLLQKKLNDIVYIQYNKKLERRFNARVNGDDDSNPIILREVDENDDWIIPTDQELQDFVRDGDDLTWDQVQEAMRATDEGPSTRRREQQTTTSSSYALRDEDDHIDVDIEHHYELEICHLKGNESLDLMVLMLISKEINSYSC